MRRTLPARLSLLVLHAVLLSGAAHAQATGSVIGKAGAIEVTDADVRRLVATLPEGNRAAVLADDAALDQLVRSELARRVVLTDARAAGFERDPTALAALDGLRDDALLRLWLERQAKLPAGYPAEDDVKRAYDAGRERLASASQLRVAQIYVSLPDGAPTERVAAGLKKVADLQSRLPAGDFAALARQYSEHAESAGKGGDLGLLPESRLLPEIRAALAGLKPGESAGPIKTAQGLHFVKLLERAPAAVPPLAELHDGIVSALRQQKSAELQQAYLAKLRTKAVANVNQVELAKLRGSLAK